MERNNETEGMVGVIRDHALQKSRIQLTKGVQIWLWRKKVLLIFWSEQG